MDSVFTLQTKMQMRQTLEDRERVCERWFALFVVAISLMSLGIPFGYSAEPSGPEITNLSTETAIAAVAADLTTAGGTITTMLINGTTQNPRWKAYVGNVSGRLALRDESNYSIFDWELSSAEGEIYATTDNEINWTKIRCANLSDIAATESALSHAVTKADSIRNTFNNTNHRTFFVADTEFSADECNHTASTYVNNSYDANSFQEIVLTDDSNLVFTALINETTYGFDENYYDFQMIVPENANLSKPPTEYYFYVELV